MVGCIESLVGFLGLSVSREVVVVFFRLYLVLGVGSVFGFCKDRDYGEYRGNCKELNVYVLKS